MSISLNDHENRIKDVEVKIPEIEERLNNVESSGYYEIVSYSRTGSGSITVDEKYSDWDYQICGWEGAFCGDGIQYSEATAIWSMTNTRMRLSARDCMPSSGRRPTMNISRNKNVFTFSSDWTRSLTGKFTVTLIFLKPTAKNLYYKFLDIITYCHEIRSSLIKKIGGGMLWQSV